MIITLLLIFLWENRIPHYFSMGMFSPFFMVSHVGSNGKRNKTSKKKKKKVDLKFSQAANSTHRMLNH